MLAVTQWLSLARFPKRAVASHQGEGNGRAIDDFQAWGKVGTVNPDRHRRFASGLSYRRNESARQAPRSSQLAPLGYGT
jgi:hypothetical protein